MGYLRRNDVAAVLDCVRDLYINPANPDFPASVVTSVAKLVPADAALFISVDLATRSSAFVSTPVKMFPEPFFNDFQRYAHQHPAFHQQAMKFLPVPRDLNVHFKKGFFRHLAEGRALKVSHSQSRSDYLRTELYNEWFKKNGIEYQMGINFVHTDSRVDAIAFTRKRGDFSERERQMLDLLGPHLRQSFELHRAFTAGKENGSIIGINDSGLSLQQYRLTEREGEVLHWVAQGKANGDIAEILDMAPRTVKKHLERIFQKLGVENRTSAALMAMEMNTAGK